MLQHVSPISTHTFDLLRTEAYATREEMGQAAAVSVMALGVADESQAPSAIRQDFP